MDYEIDTIEDVIKFSFESETRSGKSVSKIYLPKEYCLYTIKMLCQGIVDSVIGVASNTNYNPIYFFKCLLKFSTPEHPLPKYGSDEWQQFIFEFFSSYICGTANGAKHLDDRQNAWNFAKKYFSGWKANGVIPKTTKIPSARVRRQVSQTHDAQQRILGESVIELPTSEVNISRKYLVDITYTKDLDIQIEHIKNDIELKLNSAVSIAKKHWSRVTRCHETGRRLMSNYSEQQVIEALKSSIQSNRNQYDAVPYDDEKRIGLILAAAHYSIFKLEHQPNINQLVKVPFFYYHLRIHRNVVSFEKAVRNVTAENMHRDADFALMFYTLLGIPTPRDYSAAAAVIINSAPQLNPEAIAFSKLSDRNGKSHISMASKSNGVVFEVNKKRAKSCKSARLNESASAVLSSIIEITGPIRELLKKTNKSQANNIFLSSDKHSFGVTLNTLSSMNQPTFRNLYDLYLDDFESAGISRGAFTLSAIRNTSGLMEWFETGSMTSFARAMGNTERSIIRSYMPTWLLNKYNERIIRRFQQMLIICSMAESPALLHATDFATWEDLIKFVINSLSDCKNDDPFSRAFQYSASKLIDFDNDLSEAASLTVNLSINNLVLLYEMRNISIENHDEIKEIDKKLTGDLNISSLAALGNLIYVAAETAPQTHTDHAALSNLNGGSNYLLRTLHVAALRQLDCGQGLVQKLKSAKGTENVQDQPPT